MYKKISLILLLSFGFLLILTSSKPQKITVVKRFEDCCSPAKDLSKYIIEKTNQGYEIKYIVPYKWADYDAFLIIIEK